MNQIKLVCLLAAFVSLFGLFGCGSGGDGNTINPVGSIPTDQTAQTADIAFRLVLPPSSGGQSTAILADASPTVHVTFSLYLVNVGSVTTPYTLLTKSVDISTNTAGVTFSGIPVRPVIGKVSLVGGRVGTYTEFHGAIDLEAGKVNDLKCMPIGCRTIEDMVAGVLEAFITSAQNVATAPALLVTEVKKILAGLDLQRSSLDQAYSAFLNRNPSPVAIPDTKTATDTLASMTTIVKLGVSEALKTLKRNVPLHSIRASTMDFSNYPTTLVNEMITTADPAELQKMMLEMMAAPATIPASETSMGTTVKITQFTSTSVTIEYSAVTYDENSGQNKTALVRKTVWEGVQVSSFLNTVTGIQVGPGAKAAVTMFDPATDRQTMSADYTIVSGITGSFGFVTSDPFSQQTLNPSATYQDYVYKYLKNATISASITLSGTLDIKRNSTTFVDGVPGVTRNLEFFLTGFSGTISQDLSLKVGLFYKGLTSLSPETLQTAFAAQPKPVSTMQVAQTITAGMKGSSSNGVLIDQFDVSISNPVWSVQGASPTLSFEDGTLKAKMRMNQNDPSDSSYMSYLTVEVSNLDFDSAKTPKIGTGTVMTIVKVNSNNTTNTITYKFVDGQPTLTTGTTTFAGGNEAIWTQENGDLQVVGTFTVNNPDSTPLTMSYVATKSKTTGVITVHIVLRSGDVSGTMDFTYDYDSGVSQGQLSFNGWTATYDVTPTGQGTITIEHPPAPPIQENFTVTW